jgi:ribonucleoside-diphosphate reductase alpha chain
MSNVIHGITVDFSRDALFDELGLRRLKESYFMAGETSPQERFAYVASKFGSNPEHAQRLYNYASKHWLSFSTPILSYGRNKRGLPISCYLTYIPDTAEGLVNTLSETNWLSMYGGGVGIHAGMRGADEKSAGVMPHLKVYDSSSLAYKQGTTRRGSYAAFLDIDHPDILQFLEMRKPTGDQNMRTLNLNHGVNVSDKFMELIERCMTDPNTDDTWELKQPSGIVVDKVSAKELWMRLLEIRMQTGEPYIWFKDTANKSLPEFQKKLGLKNNGSNICTEISLATSSERTAVCCLSSLNVTHYDDWEKDVQFIPDVLEMLDNVIDIFVRDAGDEISRARFSAYRERAVGVGVLGFHAYLQKHNIAFEGVMAKSFNNRLFKSIRSQLDKKNEQLAIERGPCPDAAESGIMKRMSHIMAVAPNASSSIIMGNTSPSIEPFAANAYRQDTSSGAYLNKNSFLDVIIKHEAKKHQIDWYDSTWADIIANDGSVQHLEWMDEHTKYVFKTAIEIDQRWIIEHASDRQQYIDQAQSVNLFFRPDTTIKYLHAVHFMAWKGGLKSLYYCRSSKLRKAEKVGQRIERKKIEEEINMQSIVEGTTCLSCEG